MKILLTTLNAKYIHSSLALRYLEKYCQSDYYDISIQEYTINDQLDKITADIYKSGADIYTFSCYIWNITMTLEIADRLKKVNPDCKIILGGPEVSFDSAEILENHPYIDYIVMGEGEETLKELLDCISKGKGAVEEIKGITYRSIDNSIIVNQSRPLIEDLDIIPSPYNSADIKALEGKLIYYETSRGCPFNCSYCLSSTIRGVRYFSMERIKKDLSLLIEHNVKLVKFVDRTFNCDKDRTMEIFKFLLQSKKNTSFHFEIAAHLLDDEMLDFLETVPEGLFQLEIGVQSTNDLTVEAINRKTNFEKIKENVKRLRRVGNMHLHLDLIAGLPGEDYQTFTKSFNDVYELEPHALQLGFLKLLKGSNIRRQAKQYGYKFTSISPYEILESNTLSYKELLVLKGIEDVVEKYHNSGAFGVTLKYILRTYYKSPFKFFEDLAQYFGENGLDKFSHSRKALYNILYEFYSQIINNNIDVFVEYLKYDLLYHQKIGQYPYWTNKIEIDGFREQCFEFLKRKENNKKYLPQYAGLPAKKIIKQVRFEIFHYNVLDEMIDNNKKKTIILFDYSKKKAYDVSFSFE